LANDTISIDLDTIITEDTIEKVVPNDVQVIDNNTNNETSNEQHTAVETNQFPKGEKLYYVVVGCFEVESNADNYVIKLREKGCDSKKFGMRGRLHMVCCKAYSGKQEAINELNKIRADFEPNAWLLYY
jgi:hypothetical protein